VNVAVGEICVKFDRALNEIVDRTRSSLADLCKRNINRRCKASQYFIDQATKDTVAPLLDFCDKSHANTSVEHCRSWIALALFGNCLSQRDPEKKFEIDMSTNGAKVGFGIVDVCCLFSQPGELFRGLVIISRIKGMARAMAIINRIVSDIGIKGHVEISDG